ncbi:hypothetical protein M3Y97_00956200 [Aphelenchoides bicaudatus]|nr:hypothetical protein M3Y97_00956200 [Aphelenchoides bicaudatus]
MGFFDGFLKIIKTVVDIFGGLSGGQASNGRALPQPINVRISHAHGDIDTTAAPSDKIRNLKCTVHVKLGKSIAEQKIYFNGEECDDDRFLNSYGIGCGSTVQVSFDHKELTF